MGTQPGIVIGPRDGLHARIPRHALQIAQQAFFGALQGSNAIMRLLSRTGQTENYGYSCDSFEVIHATFLYAAHKTENPT